MRPSSTRCQTAATQGSRPRVSRPSISQAVVQIKKVINNINEEMQEEDKVKQAELTDLVENSTDESPEPSQ